MTALHLGPRGPIGPTGQWWLRGQLCARRRRRAPRADHAGGVGGALKHGSPVRRFTSRKGQRHLSGLWWSATTGGHVGFESWLERDHLLNLDFDPTVVGIASQPFWLHWIDAAGKPDSHAPDFFARRSDGSAVVVDCRPVERRRPRDVAKFDATARACALAGWEYRLLGEVDCAGDREPAVVRWLVQPLEGGAQRVRDDLGGTPHSRPKVTVRQRFTHYLDTP